MSRRASHRWLRRAVALATALVFAGSAAGLVGSAPQGSGGADGDATYEAEIRRVEGGIPHIVGDTPADVSFGQGWAANEDHACELLDQIVKFRGERSRWLGPGPFDTNVNADIMWRSYGLLEDSEALLARSEPEARELLALLTAFTEGWNARLAEVGSGGLSGHCAGDPWVRPIEPAEIAAYVRAIAMFGSGGQELLIDAAANAAPPDPGAAPEGLAQGPATPTAAGLALLADDDESRGSNAIAIGAERSATGGGMLLINPHYPWAGPLRFWEQRLTVRGGWDVYGANLAGLPGLAMGFTEEFGWATTVSNARNFTAYRLDLVPGSPTTYRYGDEVREMTSQDVSIDVLQDDGSVERLTRTVWSSHYGPMIELESDGVVWSDTTAYTYRDANVGNDEFLHLYTSFLQAADLDGFRQAFDSFPGGTWGNFVAVSADGRAWYSDRSSVANLTDEAWAAYEELKATDPVVQAAASIFEGIVLLDGSDPIFEWVDEPGARDPGIVPPDEIPQVERTDYVFSSNGDYWLPHAIEPLEGDFSPLYGEPRTVRTPRTRLTAMELSDLTPTGPSGDDGRFSLDELAGMALSNRGLTARLWLDEVVSRCEATPTVTVEAWVQEWDGVEVLPAATVDVGPACRVLAAWDGVYDLDSVGAVLWRELVGQFDLLDPATWAEPFDPARPIETPSGLVAAEPGGPDPAVVALARAVQVLDVAGIPIDTPLGDVQFAMSNGERIPLHGGTGRDVVLNITTIGGEFGSMDPDEPVIEFPAVPPSIYLATQEGNLGYPVLNGTCFLVALAFDDDGPHARAIMTYGNTGDPSDPRNTEAMRRYSDKEWREIPWTDEEVAASTISSVTVRA